MRGCNLMPGTMRAKHSSDVILAVIPESNALATRHCYCCWGESLKPDFYIDLYRLVGDMMLDSNHFTQTSCIKKL